MRKILKKYYLPLSLIFVCLLVIIRLFSGLNTTKEQKDTQGNKTETSNTVNQELSVLHRVISIIDGDTVDVDIDGKKERLRLIGIDTPEIVDSRKQPVQCFGKQASDKAKELLSGKEVYLESDSSQGERDKYNRLLSYVFLKDGTNFNKWMIENGYAFEYTYKSPYKYQSEFKKAQKKAKEEGNGLWDFSTCNGVTGNTTND